MKVQRILLCICMECLGNLLKVELGGGLAAGSGEVAGEVTGVSGGGASP